MRLNWRKNLLMRAPRRSRPVSWTSQPISVARSRFPQPRRCARESIAKAPDPGEQPGERRGDQFLLIVQMKRAPRFQAGGELSCADGLWLIEQLKKTTTQRLKDLSMTKPPCFPEDGPLRERVKQDPPKRLLARDPGEQGRREALTKLTAIQERRGSAGGGVPLFAGVDDLPRRPDARDDDRRWHQARRLGEQKPMRA